MAPEGLAEPPLRAELGASLSCLHLRPDKKKPLAFLDPPECIDEDGSRADCSQQRQAAVATEREEMRALRP